MHDWREPVAWLALLVVTAAALHGLYSWIGFNPTDEGFVLAQSRRILDGQVPHRDYISIRPAGSALLHVPALAAGGDSVLRLSRGIVWLELCASAFIWAAILLRRSGQRLRAAEIGLIAGIALIIGLHSRPVMTKEAVDGLLLASLGVLLAMRPARSLRLAGYVLIGAAALCKQNLALMAPVSVVALGDARDLRAWLAAGPFRHRIIGTVKRRFERFGESAHFELYR